jgi:sugar phosphate isomerase/epimerase
MSISMNRRNFIASTGGLAITSLLISPAYSAPESSKFKMGLQLFSVHNNMIKEPLATLKAVKAMGYEDFETFGFDDLNGTFYGYKASDFKNILEDLQVQANSGHYGFSPYLDKSDDDLKRFTEQCIKGAHALKMKYIVWPWMAPEQRNLENFKLLSKKLNLIGEQVTASGIGFAYHNHGFEFEDHGGENGFDIILRETDPALVKLQIDMYWIMNSSRFTPKELISKQPGRYVMWHLKDMDKVTRDYTELGNGSIDYNKILPDLSKSGLKYYYLEQGGNFAVNSMRSAATSAAYFKTHLKKYF